MADCALPACSGRSTPPTEMLVATAPTLVSMTLSRTVAISRAAMASTPAASQSCSTTPNLLEEKRPMQSLPRKRAPEAAADDGDHLVAHVEAIGLVDQGEIVDAGEQERAFGRSAPGARQEMRSAPR